MKPHKMTSRNTELLGIGHPIIPGGVQSVGLAELASAVSNFCGLGILTCQTQLTLDQQSGKEIGRWRLLTVQPLGVNLTTFATIKPASYGDVIDAIVDKSTETVDTAGSKAVEFMLQIKSAGITVIHKCVAVRHALTAERLAVEAISPFARKSFLN